MFVRRLCGDTATSFVIGGQATPAQERLMRAGRESLEASIRPPRPETGWAMCPMPCSLWWKAAGYQVVREYGGHGIGPSDARRTACPCFGKPGTGPRLVPGMVLALEVMANEGTADIRHKNDGWTVVTADGKPSVPLREDGRDYGPRLRDADAA